ncbi:M23 family metallopeptidase [Pilimelia columellifera]|uniref:M23ase beta-sheet core domain-containing protein n=1 Tax=Pilimelia columellifera subsp. columellifera TaxID=706583 RepID=A0ABN3NJ45_9ACTN
MFASRRFRPRAMVVAALGCLLVGSVATPGRSWADPRTDDQAARAAVARASALLEGATTQAQAAAQSLAAVNASLPLAQERVAVARGVVAGATVEAGTARRKADLARDAADAADRRYAASVTRVEIARQRVSDFIAATYRGAGLVTVNAVLAARNPGELTLRSGYANILVTHRQQAVDDLVALRRATKDDANAAESTRRVAAAAEAKAVAALRRARAAEADARQAAARVTALVAQRASALALARSQRVASLARYRQARVEQARIAAQLRAWEGRRGSSGRSWRAGALFLMPADGWKSSDFGSRFDPFYGVWQLHAGVDIAADAGSPVYAAADGQVIRAGWNGGYGNFTCLSHGRMNGRGLTTCYAHQSRIAVRDGQWVRAGQVIGRVGTTGASTGYHLHFEVRVDGYPVQPLRWLPSCFC